MIFFVDLILASNKITVKCNNIKGILKVIYFKKFYKKLLIFILIVGLSFCGYFYLKSSNVKQKNPMISVVIPTHNRASLLSRALDSVLNQSYQDFEIVVVDDASTDKTAQLLNLYKRVYPDKFVIYKNDENRGVSISRNIGNKLARGKYILVLDSDDYFLPGFFENGVRYMEENPEITIGVPSKLIYFEDKNNPKNVQPFFHNYDLYEILNGNPLGNVGNFFRRDFMVKHNIKYKEDYICAEDYDFWVQMILKGAKIGWMYPEKGQLVYRLGGDLSLRWDCYYNSQKIIKEILSKIDYTPKDNYFFICDAVDKFLQKYPNTFNEPIMDKYHLRCREEVKNAVVAIHPKWTDHLIIDKERKTLYRFNWTVDGAKIITFEPKKKLVIKWDRYGKETFLYDEKTSRYILKGFKLK